MRAGLAWQRSPQSAECPNRSFAELAGSWTYEPACRGLWPWAFMSCSSRWGRGFSPIRTLTPNSSRPLDPRTSYHSYNRSVFLDAARNCVRVVFANRIRDGLCCRRLARRCRAGISRGFHSVRSLDPISAARMAADCRSGRGPRRSPADRTISFGSSAHSGASVVVAWIATLIRAVDAGRPPPWLLIPLMTLWANLHGSFLRWLRRLHVTRSGVLHTPGD